MAVSITCSPAGDLPTSQFADKIRPDYTLSHTVSASTNHKLVIRIGLFKV